MSLSVPLWLFSGLYVCNAIIAIDKNMSCKKCAICGDVKGSSVKVFFQIPEQIERYDLVKNNICL